MKNLKAFIATIMVLFSHIATAECIFTPEDFDKIRMNLNGNYQLCDDIDMTGFEFVPIGNSTAPFTGTFNGLGHTIKNLELKERGIFGFIQGTVEKPASIKALLLENITLNLKEGPRVFSLANRVAVSYWKISL